MNRRIDSIFVLVFCLLFATGFIVWRYTICGVVRSNVNVATQSSPVLLFDKVRNDYIPLQECKDLKSPSIAIVERDNHFLRKYYCTEALLNRTISQKTITIFLLTSYQRCEYVLNKVSPLHFIVWSKHSKKQQRLYRQCTVF